MENKNEESLIKTRSPRACVSYGFKLYMGQFKRIFLSTWWAQLAFAVVSGVAFEVLTGILFAFIYQYGLRYILNIPDKFIEKMENHCCCKWMLKLTGFVSVSHITNKFMDEKLNQRMTGQILNLNKPSTRKKTANTASDSERSVKIQSEYVNRSENSMISNATPPSLLEISSGINKPTSP